MREVCDLPIVAQMTIQQPKAQVNLRKKGDTWVVSERADYPANFEMISTLIRKVWELKPVQEVKVGPSQLGRLSLLQPGQGEKSGTLRSCLERSICESRISCSPRDVRFLRVDM